MIIATYPLRRRNLGTRCGRLRMILHGVGPRAIKEGTALHLHRLGRTHLIMHRETVRVAVQAVAQAQGVGSQPNTRNLAKLLKAPKRVPVDHLGGRVSELNPLRAGRLAGDKPGGMLIMAC